LSSDVPESSFRDHERAVGGVGPLGFAVITLSDTRTPETDRSGRWIREAVVQAGHAVVRYRVVRDETEAIRAELEAALADPAVAVIVTNGGTGISRRDCAFRVITEVLDERLEGFGELFRMLSYQEIGSAAMLSRAVGGVVRQKVVFALPGSTAAVRLGMERLILPQAAHLYRELHKE